MEEEEAVKPCNEVTATRYPAVYVMHVSNDRKRSEIAYVLSNIIIKESEMSWRITLQHMQLLCLWIEACTKGICSCD